MPDFSANFDTAEQSIRDHVAKLVDELARAAKRKGPGIFLRRAEIAGARLDGKCRLRRHLHGDRMPAAALHALCRISQHVALPELIEDLREGADRRIAESRSM